MADTPRPAPMTEELLPPGLVGREAFPPGSETEIGDGDGGDALEVIPTIPVDNFAPLPEEAEGGNVTILEALFGLDL